MQKLGIYVQVPFCQTKCTYCNFHTGVVAKGRFAPYVEAVCREIRGHKELLKAAEVDWKEADRRAADKRKQILNGAGLAEAGRSGRSSAAPLQGKGHGLGNRLAADTVYFGGGTPSLLEARQLQEVLETIRETFNAKGSGGVEVDGGFSTQRTQRAQRREAGEEKRISGAGPRQGEEQSGSESNTYTSEMGRAKARPYNWEFEEVTLEADPETVEAEKADAWVRMGINRVSFGVQSLSDKELAAAGRMHRRADIYRAVPILRDAGIGNISFDLIAGLPHQTRESWKQSLEELTALAPEHVSVYLLEVDEGSRLGKELLAGGTRYSAGAVPAEDEMAGFYEMAQEALGAAGYRHYEISNWAMPGFESKHNLKYWRREPYLGFGAGAHSFSGTQRWANAHDAAAYVSAVESGRLPVEQLETVTAEMALEEELFLGLRQLSGIDVRKIEREYGVALEARFEPLAAVGLVEREGNVVRLSEGKLSVSNEVFVELMR